MGSLASWQRRFGQNAIDRDHPVRSLGRWPRWLIACATGAPTEARFATGGLRMRLTPRLTSFGSTSIFIKRDNYEPELKAVQRLIVPGSVVLDIGASFGVFSLFMAHYAGPHGRIIAFEPGHFSHAQLTANLAMNDAGARVTVHNVAASDAESVLKLYHLGGSPVNFSAGGIEGAGFEEVRAARIDAIVPADDQRRVSFIKIDVEGYEKSALEGARAILEAQHPTIMFEVSASALSRQGMRADDMYAYLATYGYRFFMLDRRERFIPVVGCPDGNIFASVDDLGPA